MRCKLSDSLGLSPGASICVEKPYFSRGLLSNNYEINTVKSSVFSDKDDIKSQMIFLVEPILLFFLGFDNIGKIYIMQ